MIRRSDGTQPHLINVQFHKKMRIEVLRTLVSNKLRFGGQEIVMYTDYKLDESYTASKISIREGTDLYDLHVSYPAAKEPRSP